MTYKDGDEYVEPVDESVLISYPQRTNESGLEDHPKKWLELQLKVGKSMGDLHLKIMLIKTLPSATAGEIENKIEFAFNLRAQQESARL